MKVRVIYDSILRQVMKPVTVFDEQLKKEADEMVETMHQHNGIGLAANQVGLDKQLIVLEYKRQDKDDTTPEIPRTVLCNPKIIKWSNEKEVMTEGCLSLPGLELPVERSVAVVVEAQNLRGEKVTIKAKGLFARVLQHEVDHLNGILFSDHVQDYADVKNYRFAKIVFFGSDEFSLPILKSLHETGYQVIAAICETDKRAGRGDAIVESPVKTYATDNGIAVFNPSTKEEITKIIAQVKPELVVLASYGKILPQEMLEIPAFGSLNVHPSLLPKYRGATPLQSAILAGDSETGVSIMTMNQGVDTGNIVAQQTEKITDRDTTSSLKARLSEIGAALLLKTIPSYLSGQATVSQQNDSIATPTFKLKKEQGKINWAESVEEIDRKIRAFSPWPGTYTQLGEKRLLILEAEIKNNLLLPVMVQLEGKKPTNWADFVRGYQSQLTRELWYDKIYR